MTPEITWTRLNPDQVEAWHLGRQWVLLRRTRQSNGNRAGWYLHSTLGPGALADEGQWMSGRRTRAEGRATALLLSPEGRVMAETADREASITEEEHMTPEMELPDRESLVDEAEAVEFDRRASGIDEEHPHDFRDVE